MKDFPQCSYGSSKLFDTPRCQKTATAYLFHEAYCDEHAKSLTEVHKLFNCPKAELQCEKQE